MPRSRRAKSQSISSNIEEDVLVNGSMPPPSPPSSRASPNLTRHRKTPSAANGAPVAITHAVPKQGATIPSIPAHRPGVAKFILVVILSSLAEATLQSVASQVGGGDLATISKHSEDWVEVVALLAWKFFTLGVYWFGGFDGMFTSS